MSRVQRVSRTHTKLTSILCSLSYLTLTCSIIHHSYKYINQIIQVSFLIIGPATRTIPFIFFVSTLRSTNWSTEHPVIMKSWQWFLLFRLSPVQRNNCSLTSPLGNYRNRSFEFVRSGGRNQRRGVERKVQVSRTTTSTLNFLPSFLSSLRPTNWLSDHEGATRML